MSHYGRTFKPFDIGIFSIIPEGETIPAGCPYPLVLGKKGAFGSGEHETTAACLEFLAEIPHSGRFKALDLGSGTAILAIASGRLGAELVVAVDIDWNATLSGEQNIRLNDMDNSIVSVCGELACLSATLFDLVMANIYADIHMALASEMIAMTRPGGHLILSGIPLQDKFDIQQSFLGKGCEIIDSRIGEDYATYLMRRSV
jgi:ribosomal protein L11 methyltransferase